MFEILVIALTATIIIYTAWRYNIEMKGQEGKEKKMRRKKMIKMASSAEIEKFRKEQIENLKKKFWKTKNPQALKEIKILKKGEL